MNTLSKTKLARLGEDIAAMYLVNKGYSLICRNYRTPQGEIDLIVDKDQQLVFVEVKTRSYRSLDSALASVSFRKQTHITKVAQSYCNLNPRFDQHNTRFDVIVAFFDAASQSFSVEHFEDAFIPTDIS